MTTAITIGTDIVPVTADETHEYLVETALVAKGYGISTAAIRKHKERQADELVEGQHFISVTNSHADTRGGKPKVQTLWTKLGVITLGFFIKSDRAKQFRKAAAALVLRVMEPVTLTPAYLRQIADTMEQNALLIRFRELMSPHGNYGELGRNGKPKTGLVAPYWRAGMKDRLLAQQVRGLQEQLEFYLQLHAA